MIIVEVLGYGGDGGTSSDPDRGCRREHEVAHETVQQIVSASSIATVVWNALQIAMEEHAGPVHLELPEDVAAEKVSGVSVVPLHPTDLPEPSMDAVEKAAEIIHSAKCPLLMFEAGASRPRLAPALSELVRRVKIPFFNT